MLTIPDYQIKEQLYESAHSTVYRGQREADTQPVILKLLKNEYPTPEELARFRREYQMTRSLEIEGVISVYALEPCKNSLVMVLEDFGGESLTRLMSDRTLELDELLRLAIRIAEIVGAIHHRHIMHKDINPSNIVWNPDTDQLKLIDFGISTELSREQPEIRNPNVLEGTLAYMSPEQTGRMNRAMDYRTDLYSLGVTLYHLLTGQLPFQAEDAMELVHCHLAKMPVPPGDIVGAHRDAPFERAVREPPLQIISDIIMKLLAKNAEDRYQSAYGLKVDLEYVLKNLTGLQDLSGFTLAQHDISERFQIPQKLYGREPNIDTLLVTFDRVSKGATELMLVTGYAGIGKSALVHEIHKPITEKRGYFISGKYDQFQHNIPYSALIQAFQRLMRHLLAEPEEQLARWKETLLHAVGLNGQIVIDVIPDLCLIIGEQPDVPEVSPNQAQNRFNFVFQNFVRACASTEHPLVIFLDDLQWADWASLNLLEFFMADARTQGMLIIGAYRDNEVSDAHPVMLTLNEIRKTGATVETITLMPLALEHVEQLVAETLHVGKVPHPSPLPEGEGVFLPSPRRRGAGGEVLPPLSSQMLGSELAELLLQKTGGNPFFLRQFLQTLYEEECVSFDPEQGRWTWNLEDIQQRQMTDNVVDLMASKIQKLPEETQQVLELAACIGNQFDLQTLSIVYEKSPADTLHALWDALQEELILPLDDSYKYVEAGKDLSGFGQPGLLGLTGLKFLHDRIQQAAYSLIEEEHKQEVHLKIGRLLLEKTPEHEREEQIFDIVNHLNLGRPLISRQAEKDRLAHLNLTAGRKAKASAAYQAAFTYLQSGIDLLEDESWQRQYALTLALHEETAEAAYLSGDFDEMECLAEIVLNRVKTVLEQVTVYDIKIRAYTAQSKLPEAVQTALHAWKLLGVHFPEHPTKLHILGALLTTKWVLARTPLEDVETLPDMTDPSLLAATRIMVSAIAAVYFTAPDLLALITPKWLNWTVKHGKTPYSAYLVAGYGFILCGVLGEIESGYRFGQLALRLLEQPDARKAKPQALFLVPFVIQHWKEHLRNTLPHLLEAYQVGLETGDVEYASHSILSYGIVAIFIGSELGDMERQLAHVSHSLVQLKQERNVYPNEMYRQMIVNLMNDVDDPCRLIGNSYDEEQMLPFHVKANDLSAMFQVYFIKLFLCYLFHEDIHAVEHSIEAETYIDCMTGQIFVPLFHFYDSLARLAVFPEAPRREQKRILKKVTANQKKMKKWAFHAPMNYLHKWYLVEAERARVLGKDLKAMEYYDKAIEGAKEHEYLNEEALANEVAARFYLSRGRDQIARTYMREARYCYLKWGAKNKVRHLDETYQELLTKQEDGRHLEGEAHLTLTRTPSTGTTSQVLDVATLMKASQTIAGEIVLEKLLSKMIRIVIENAGAQKGMLLLEKDGEWEIAVESQEPSAKPRVKSVLSEVEGSEASPRVFDFQDTSRDTPGDSLRSTTGESPASIIKYVIRTQEPVVLHDAAREGDFTRDPYITSHQPKSLLCLPLLNQGKLSGMLYLENNLTTGAFTSERVELLNLLSSQMAISIENAQLYTNLTAFNTAYERFVPAQFLSFLEKGSIVDVQLGDQIEREMTILFSDIRDFTTLSENMTPQENFNFINSYLSRMEPIILDHQGFIDKYIGDAIMALFPTNADDAVQAGIAMLSRLTEYNQERQKAGYAPVRIGVGINTGSLMLGTVGSQNRMDGTVISNAVNVASRIEGLTKIYGASIVISEQTLACLKDRSAYNTRFLGKVQVKGKKEAVSVFEIYDGDPEEIITLKHRTKKDFEEGLDLYYAKEFAEAAVCFKQVLKANPGDKPAKLYLERSAQLMVQGVPEEWDGIETLEHK